MIIQINELQAEVLQTIRGNVSEVEDDSFTLSDSSGNIEVDLDDDDLGDDDNNLFGSFNDDDDDDDDNNLDLDDFLNEIDGEEVTVVGRLSDDDDNDDDSEFEALRVTRTSESLVFRDLLLDNAIDLEVENNNFVQDSDNGIIVNGNEGNDNLTGAGGNDFLIGGAGDDLLRGTGGYDTFVVNNGADIITDFEPADAIAVGNSFDDIGQILGDGGAATQMGADTFIDLGNDNSVTLFNFAVEDLNLSHFALT